MDFELTNTLLFGVGIFLLAYPAFQVVGERASWWLARRHRSRSWRLRGATTQERQEIKEQGLPWTHIYLVTALLVLILFNWTGQVVVLGMALVPFALRSWLETYGRKQIESESLNWLIDLRINLPLHGSLLRTMRTVSESSETRLARMTSRYLGRGFQGDGLELLERLAEDTQLSHLTDLVARVKATTEGTLNIDRPFEHALEQLRSEIYTQAREYQQRIPSRLTLLIFPVLLGPTIALLILPMAARLMATISGSSG